MDKSMSFAIPSPMLNGSWNYYQEQWHEHLLSHQLNPHALSASWYDVQKQKYHHAWHTLGLSARLASVAELCPTDYIVIDVGTDHAQLPLALLRSQKIKWTAGVDVHRQPLISTIDRLTYHKTHPHLLLIEADGFAPWNRFPSQTTPHPFKKTNQEDETRQTSAQKLYSGSVEQWPHAWFDAWSNQTLCATLCGMGSHKMIQIMNHAPSALHTFIVQSNHNHQMLYDYFQTYQEQHIPDTRITTDENKNKYYDMKISFVLDHDRLFVNFFVQKKSVLFHESGKKLSSSVSQEFPQHPHESLSDQSFQVSSKPYTPYINDNKDHLLGTRIPNKAQTITNKTPTLWYKHASLRKDPLLPLYLYYRCQYLQKKIPIVKYNKPLQEELDSELFTCKRYLASCLSMS